MVVRTIVTIEICFVSRAELTTDCKKFEAALITAKEISLLR
jgi:hypothetical protein